MESRPELRFPAFRNRGFHSPELRFPVAGLRESFQPEYSCLSASALRGSATRNGWLSTTDGLALVERNTQRFPAERNGDAQYSGTMIPSGPEWRFPRTGISTSTEKAYGSSTSAPPTTFEIPWLRRRGEWSESTLFYAPIFQPCFYSSYFMNSLSYSLLFP